MASRVAGSSQDNGSRTRAARHDQLIRRGQLAVETCQQLGHLRIDSTPGIELHLQRAHAGGEVDDAGDVLSAQMFVQRVHPGPQARSSTIGPYSTSTPSSPRGAA